MGCTVVSKLDFMDESGVFVQPQCQNGFVGYKRTKPDFIECTEGLNCVLIEFNCNDSSEQGSCFVVSTHILTFDSAKFGYHYHSDLELEEKFQFEIVVAKTWFPCAVLFFINLYSSLQSLIFISVSTFTVLRNTKPLLAVCMDFVLRGKKNRGRMYCLSCCSTGWSYTILRTRFGVWYAWLRLGCRACAFNDLLFDFGQTSMSDHLLVGTIHVIL